MSKGIKVVEIEKDRYSVMAAADDRKGTVECQLLGFIERCLNDGQNHGAATGIFKLIEMFAVSGSEGLTTDQSHYVDQKNKIYQLKKGDLRVLYFYADDKSIVICSHGFIKSTQKAEKREVRRAIRLKKEYFSSMKMEVVELEDDKSE